MRCQATNATTTVCISRNTNQELRPMHIIHTCQPQSWERLSQFVGANRLGNHNTDHDY